MLFNILRSLIFSLFWSKIVLRKFQHSVASSPSIIFNNDIDDDNDYHSDGYVNKDDHDRNDVEE